MNYFIHNERDLSRAYVKSCKKFLNNLKLKKKNSGPGRNRTPRPQAPSGKLDKLQAVGYNRIMKTFIFEDKEYQFKDMEEANDKPPLGEGAWFGPKEGMPANT